MKIFVGAGPAHLLPEARLRNRSCQSSLRWVDCLAWAGVGFACVRLVLVARLTGCALGMCCVLLGGLGPVCIGFCLVST
jgi:hypothetical protein